MNWTQCVRHAQAQDAGAWENLYIHTRREAYFVALKICGNQQDAEDLVQDAYLVAFSKLSHVQEPEKFPKWLNMIVANKCRDYLKRKKPALFTELYQDDAPPLDWPDDRERNLPDVQLDHQETVRLVAEMIDSLSEDQKLCLLLYYRDELSVAQIAEALQISEGTVKSRLNYGRQKVRAKVEELAKQGTKLYGLAPMPLLALLLRQESEATALPATLTAATAADSATAVAGSVASGSAMVGGKVAGGLAVKIVAGMLAASLTVGGVVIVKYAGSPSSADVSDAPQAEVSVDKQVAQAYAAYEQLLRQGVTDSGLEIKYYTTFDLEKDGIPELLVANNPGTREWLTDAQFYSYDSGELQMVGDASSYYAPIYVVNDAYLRCMWRPGVSFVSKTGQFYKDRTDADYEYYYFFPWETDSDTFMKTARQLELKPNTFIVSSGYIVNVGAFTLHFPAEWAGKVDVECSGGDTSAWERFTVYETTNHAVGAGELFCITLLWENDTTYTYWPNYQHLGTFMNPASGVAYQFVASHPTDVQFTPETQEIYTELYDQYKSILESIQWNWPPHIS